MKIFHVGDTHWSNKRLDDKIQSAARLTDHAHSIAPDLIIHAGDLFDAPIRMEEPGALASMRWMSEMRNIAPIILVRGNPSHDRDSVELTRFVKGDNDLVLSKSRTSLVFGSRSRTLARICHSL